MLAHGHFMLLLYAQQMKGRKLSVGEALRMIERADLRIKTRSNS